jgi:hypothetical protein
MVVRPKQHRNAASVAIVLALIIAALAMVGLGAAGIAPRDLVDALFAAPSDGSWKATTLNGRPVASRNYVIVIRRGKLVGGYDDCNGWSYQDEGLDKNGERKVLSTLVECAAGDELRRLYWILVHAPRIHPLGANDLRLSRGGHAGMFHRCRPNAEHSRCVEVQ